MAVRRRTMLAVTASGVLTGCSGATASAPKTTPAQATQPTGPASSRSPRPSASASPVPTRAEIVARYGKVKPTHWGLEVTGALSRLSTTRKVTALTFDACGGRGGSAYDKALIEFLRQSSVPATLFLNSRWIDENPAVFKELAADPLFEIANHGTRHLPLSVSGRSAYQIPGTRDAGEAYDEVAGNRAKLTDLLGHPPRFFRSGTAYCDDVAARIVTDLGERFASFDVNGDGGATFTPEQVQQAMRAVRPGSVVIGHMNHPHGGTARGMRMAVPRLLDSGYTFVRLTDGVRA
ncbi:polysaccharide deacetylase family protein [Streptomyces sp. CBMA152]|uniref:polysaccharide deacetylase family protein n=1 Tax=Streptomyces sp. CBMA152 TaxID=1896312 RepID=UPI00166024CE|nr:polysaccharide deacetylase family protein [Streptomyces sp. CBMA152]